MLGWAAVAGKGRFNANDPDLTWVPRSGTAGRAVILCHGAGNSAVASFASPSVNPKMTAVAQTLAGAGFLVGAADFGGLQTWGNDASLPALEAVRAGLVGLGAAADKVLLVAFSMGNLTALNYARANPNRVAAVAGIMPASDLNDIRDNNRMNSRDLINTAYGLAAGSTSATAPLPATANPLGNAAAIKASGLTYQSFYSSADTVVLPGTVTALATAIGGTATQVSSSLDHSDAIAGVVDLAALAQFLDSHR